MFDARRGGDGEFATDDAREEAGDGEIGEIERVELAGEDIPWSFLRGGD